MFEAQQCLVNHIIILTVQAGLNQTIFSVDDNIIYDLIHEQYQHQKELYLLQLKSKEEQDKQARRQHKNTHAREVSD